MTHKIKLWLFAACYACLPFLRAVGPYAVCKTLRVRIPIWIRRDYCEPAWGEQDWITMVGQIKWCLVWLWLGVRRESSGKVHFMYGMKTLSLRGKWFAAASTRDPRRPRHLWKPGRSQS